MVMRLPPTGQAGTETMLVIASGTGEVLIGTTAGQNVVIRTAEIANRVDAATLPALARSTVLVVAIR